MMHDHAPTFIDHIDMILAKVSNFVGPPYSDYKPLTIYIYDNMLYVRCLDRSISQHATWLTAGAAKTC